MQESINAYSAEIGYCVTATNSGVQIFYNLWFTNGPVKYLDVRPETGEVMISARFYESGKLQSFRQNTPNYMQILFTQDGNIEGYSWKTKTNVEIDVGFDDLGNVKIRGFNLNN